MGLAEGAGMQSGGCSRPTGLRGHLVSSSGLAGETRLGCEVDGTEDRVTQRPQVLNSGAEERAGARNPGFLQTMQRGIACSSLPCSLKWAWNKTLQNPWEGRGGWGEYGVTPLPSERNQSKAGRFPEPVAPARKKCDRGFRVKLGWITTGMTVSDKENLS